MNTSQTPARLSADEKKALLEKYHPDYQAASFTTLKVGANTGQKAPIELAEMLHSNSRIYGKSFDPDAPDYVADVLIIGGGGAGASAAIEAHHAGAKVLLVTKLRMGDANSMMAEGGIQAADKANDSPAQHYLDAFGGGHYAAKPELLKQLVMDGPQAIDWLSSLGVMFDKEADGTMITTHGGGTSRKRMHACADYTGAEITRVLRDEVHQLNIPVVEYTAAIELLLDENGNACGALLMNMLTEKYEIAHAKTVILATGGAGRMHYNGFPTSNHYGATADGLVLAYRAGAALLYQDALQYHPTGVAFPAQLFGALVTEKVRALGAGLFNAEGEAFVHPLETRDVVSAAIMAECKKGKGVLLDSEKNFSAVWLDAPNIDRVHGEGHIEKHIPGMLRMLMNYDIDIRKQPILVYPTLHYQNGGIDISPDGSTPKIPNLYVAGEAVGGIHGRNRLMGNSLLDIIVFGRLTGKNAAKKAREVSTGKPALQHVEAYAQALKEAGISTGVTSPKLLPAYTRSVNE
ncbi:MAG: FAD-dependent oxidoreductase [Defluviitaleaceae bacterium]|nr:FAD-dependent oxidoreductase [Defluviitaleaceae bacterium]MCL2275094.1 FAD-dependent oxidoreductase [Defluviitaleaceae bacterium]